MEIEGEKDEPKIIEIPRSASSILADITAKTKDYPVAVGGALYAVDGERLIAMPDATRPFAWCGTVFDSGGRSKVRWTRADGAKTKEEFFATAVQLTNRYDAVSE